MPIVFASAGSHAPGMTAWAEAAPADQKQRLYQAYEDVQNALRRSRPDVVILLTSEHWSNFFLDHIGAFCVGRAEHFDGPVEPWLKVPKSRVPGHPAFAAELIDALYAADFEPSFSHSMELDHGSMVPLHFVTPAMDTPVVPIMFNTLASPQPSARRCLELGRAIGRFAEGSPHRVAIVATGGLSHDPGERNHGVIDPAFDRQFLQEMADGKTDRLAGYTTKDLLSKGAGTMELLSWVALAGAIEGRKGEILAYEAVKPWGTGIGLLTFPMNVAAAA
jgi:aromatic ring-opening dioxygenase catalytic subunit (LigB family)